MTAVDVDALDKLHVVDRWGDECQGCRANCLYCEGDHPWPCPVVELLAEVRRGRALREAVEGLADGAASAADLPVLKGDRFDAGVAATYRSYADRLHELLAAVDPS